MNTRKYFLSAHRWPVFLSLSPIALFSQDFMTPLSGDAVRLRQTDFSVLESHERRRDLPCTVKPEKPELGFDLKFHAGYSVTLPAEELQSPSEYVVILRITSLSRHEPFHMQQRVRTAGRAENSPDVVGVFDGRFSLGEGNYQIDWLMRDGSERICSDFWPVQVSPPSRKSEMSLMIAPGDVQPADSDQFQLEPVARHTAEALPPVRVLLNFAPLNPASAALDPHERDALLSMVKNVVRDPNVGPVSLVVFNLDRQQVFLRQEDRIDLSALRDATKSVDFGTINAGALREGGDAKFLAGLLQPEREGAPSPEALIFIGPPAGEPDRSLSELKHEVTAKKLFYLNYNPYPAAAPWSDGISRLVQFFKGRKYAIQQPRDFLAAWPDLLSRIRSAVTGTSQTEIASQ